MGLPSDIYLEESPPLLDENLFQGKLGGGKRRYLKRLAKWQHRLLHVQQVYYHQDRKAVIVFEGPDAAGKGGAIRRITEKLDPRGFDVFPISAPTDAEKAEHYLDRFRRRLPDEGKMAIFDRSWYGRVLVERVEGFASHDQWQAAYDEINQWEHDLVAGGYRIVKVFLHITAEEQLKRFEERLNNPLKQWKLTSEDIRNRERWNDYETAFNDMFRKTSTQAAPWHLIGGNRKWFARVEVLKTVVKALEADVDLVLPRPDPLMVQEARQKLGIKLKFS